MSNPKKYILHILFLIGIIIKCINGILELIGGFVLIFTKSNFIANIVQAIFQHELVQDPTDFIANYFIQASQHLSVSVLLFLAVYLIIHGIVKIGLFLGLWYEKLWAYPLAAVVLSLLIIYQSIRIFAYHSLVLLFLTLLDVVILVLLRFEYRRLKIKN